MGQVIELDQLQIQFVSIDSDLRLYNRKSKILSNGFFN